MMVSEAESKRVDHQKCVCFIYLQKLSLQRQMMENLIIAKARQDAVSFCWSEFGWEMQDILMRKGVGPFL